MNIANRQSDFAQNECPKCGSAVRREEDWGFVYQCGSVEDLNDPARFEETDECVISRLEHRVESLTIAAKELLEKLDSRIDSPDGWGPDFGSPSEHAEWLVRITERLRNALKSPE